MNVKSSVENKEQFSVELVIEVSPEEFEAAVERVYKKSRSSISVPGFRKGKAPRKIIEGMYGSGVFYQDAIEEVYPTACEEAVASQNLDVVAPPQVEIIEAGKEGFSFKATVTVRPEVSIKDYKGLEANKILPTVTDADVEKEIETFIGRATRLEAVERAAENGDTAVIDFEGFKDGIPFSGGKGENFDLELGSGSFIPGFEEQIVGMTAGEEKEISVSFPEDYQAKELAGKPALFKVKLHEVKTKIAPELDAEFAKDVSEFDTLAAFKEDLRSKIADRNMAQSDNVFKQAVLDKLSELVTIELPAPMVEGQINRMMEDYGRQLEQQGISLEMYMNYMQTSELVMREELRPAALRQVRTQLALDAVVKQEKITVTDEVMAEEMKKLAEGLKMSVEEVQNALPLDTYRRDLARDQAMNIVIAAAKPNLVSAEDAISLEAVTADEAPKEEKPKRTRKPKAAADKEKAEEAEATEEKPKKTRAKKTADQAEATEAAPKKTAAKKPAEKKPAAKKAAPKKDTAKGSAEE